MFKPTPAPSAEGNPSANPSAETPTPSSNSQSNSGKPGEAGENPDSPVMPPLPSDMDDYKHLSTVEKNLIRKFLSVINSMNDLPQKQKDRIKTKLRKKIIK